MKPSSISFKTIVVLIAISFSVACSKKLNFSSSAVVPAAEGTVTYKKSSNNNYSINARILHLADPKKLMPSRNHYVLWMETENNGIKNVGQITSSSGWFSSTRKASLTTVTPFKPKSFFITAEDNPNISYAGNQIVLRTE